MMTEQNYGAHSAQVRMRLFLNGRSIRITHMAPEFILVDSPIDHPPGDASILMEVDDHESQWRVKLPEGMSKASNRVALAVSE